MLSPSQEPARTPLELLLARVALPPLLVAAGLGWRAVDSGDRPFISGDRPFIFDSLWKSGQRPFMLGSYQPWLKCGAVLDVWNRLNASALVRDAINAETAAFPGGEEVFGRVNAVTADWKKVDRAVIAREMNRFRGHSRKVAQTSDDILVLFDVEKPSMIAGWSCPEFEYVKAVFRGHGLEALLTRFWHGE